MTIKRIIAVYPDYSIFIYHHNELCLAICKSRVKKGELETYHEVEITGGHSKQLPTEPTPEASI